MTLIQTPTKNVQKEKNPSGSHLRKNIFCHTEKTAAKPVQAVQRRALIRFHPADYFILLFSACPLRMLPQPLQPFFHLKIVQHICLKSFMQGQGKIQDLIGVVFQHKTEIQMHHAVIMIRIGLQPFFTSFNVEFDICSSRAMSLTRSFCPCTVYFTMHSSRNQPTCW